MTTQGIPDDLRPTQVAAVTIAIIEHIDEVMEQSHA